MKLTITIKNLPEDKETLEWIVKRLMIPIRIDIGRDKEDIEVKLEEEAKT